MATKPKLKRITVGFRFSSVLSAKRLAKGDGVEFAEIVRTALDRYVASRLAERASAVADHASECTQGGDPNPDAPDDESESMEAANIRNLRRAAEAREVE